MESLFRTERIAIPGSLTSIFKEIHQTWESPFRLPKIWTIRVAQGVFPYEFRPHSTCHETGSPEHGMGNLHRRCYQEIE